MRTWVQAKLKAFRRDTRATVAVLFALTAVPAIAVTGAAVDYARASRIQVRLQSVMDASVLAATARSVGKTNSQIEADARALFNAQYDLTPAPTLTVTASTGALDMTASVDMPTSILGIVGITTIPISVSARTAVSTVRIRLALALDTTGSMLAFNKLSIMKTATTNLLTQLQNSAKSAEDVYVSIVPFARVVNVGVANQNESWLRISDVTSCILWWCSVNWGGAVQDRDQPYDVQNTAPNGNPKRFPPVTDAASGGLPVPLMGLSNNWTALKTKVNDLNAAGNTNQQIGLAWAWQTLTSGAPMNPPAMDTNYTYQSIIILISDGQNTQNRYSLIPSEIDARQRILCDNIKAEGIKIYAIQVNTDGLPRSAVMEYCASGPANFTMLTDPNKLGVALAQIGADISRLRLAR